MRCKWGSMKLVVSVSKTHTNRGQHRHRPTTKKYWHVYYYDEEGNFCTERVNFLQALYYKAQKRHRIKLVCTECGRFFIGLLRSRKDKVECPYCSG